MSRTHWSPITSAAAFLLSLTPAIPSQATAQEPVHWDVVSRIRAEGFGNSQVAEYTAYLSDVIGPRVTASPAMRQAQAYLMDRMEEIGLAEIQTEPWGEHTVGWVYLVSGSHRGLRVRLGEIQLGRQMERCLRRSNIEGRWHLTVERASSEQENPVFRTARFPSSQSFYLEPGDEIVRDVHLNRIRHTPWDGGG